MISQEEADREDALRAKARQLFDAHTLSWRDVNPHTWANIRLTFVGATALGEVGQLEALAARYWPGDKRAGALGQLMRLYRSVRGDESEGTPDVHSPQP